MDSVQNIIDTIQYFFLLAFVAGIGVLGLTFISYLGFLFWKYRNREEESLNSVLLQVAVPADNEIKVDAAEQLFASLYSIKKGGRFSFLKPQPHLAFEIVAKHEDIRFYVSVPFRLKDLVEKQIHGAYPDAEVLEVSEYNLFSKEGKVAFATFQLGGGSYYPIKLYKDLPTDPLSSITSALAKMGKDEGAAIQILIAPADSKWQKQGKSFISGTKKEEADPEKAKFSVDAKTLEAVENKCSKFGFKTVVRMVVSAPTEEQAKSHLDNIKGTFSQFSSDLNGFKGKKIRFKKFFMLDFIYRYMPIFHLFGEKMILNSEELATIFHFPNKQIETPHLYWLYSKTAPAPAGIPKSGLYLGKSVFRGVSREVYLSEKDRQRHIYIIGKTGTGKTELMRDLILQDIRAGRGACLIDPHDLAEDLLAYIPPERAEEVIYFDPSDTERPVGLNLLEAETEEQQHFITTAIINLMYKLYDPYKTGIIGPRFEHAIRNAMLTVMQAQPEGTFVEVMRVLQDPNFVQELLPRVKDPIVRRYWTDQIAQTADFHKSEVLDYIVSKFGRFVTNKVMRNIIGQSKSSFDFRKVMDEGKILIVNLAKGKMGEENSSFLGLVLVPRILIAAMSRQDIPEEQRKDFYLFVDEFQNFATPDFAQILSEARKYHLNLCVANQFIGQMEDEIKNAIFGNVGSIISFQIGVTDANFLQHWFTPTFSEEDLLNIDRFNAYIKTIAEGEPLPSFSMDLTKDMGTQKQQASPEVAKMIKQLSRLKFGRDKEIVESELVQRARL